MSCYLDKHISTKIVKYVIDFIILIHNYSCKKSKWDKMLEILSPYAKPHTEPHAKSNTKPYSNSQS